MEDRNLAKLFKEGLGHKGEFMHAERQWKEVEARLRPQSKRKPIIWLLSFAIVVLGLFGVAQSLGWGAGDADLATKGNEVVSENEAAKTSTNTDIDRVDAEPNLDKSNGQNSKLQVENSDKENPSQASANDLSEMNKRSNDSVDSQSTKTNGEKLEKRTKSKEGQRNTQQTTTNESKAKKALKGFVEVTDPSLKCMTCEEEERMRKNKLQEHEEVASPSKTEEHDSLIVAKPFTEVRITALPGHRCSFTIKPSSEKEQKEGDLGLVSINKKLPSPNLPEIQNSNKFSFDILMGGSYDFISDGAIIDTSTLRPYFGFGVMHVSGFGMRAKYSWGKIERAIMAEPSGYNVPVEAGPYYQSGPTNTYFNSNYRSVDLDFSMRFLRMKSFRVDGVVGLQLNNYLDTNTTYEYIGDYTTEFVDAILPDLAWSLTDISLGPRFSFKLTPSIIFEGQYQYQIPTGNSYTWDNRHRFLVGLNYKLKK